MPTISHFYGIIIVIYLLDKKHNPPHIHAITQAELSKMTGIDQGDISKIENGTANPSINTLKRIADAFSIKFR